MSVQENRKTPLVPILLGITVIAIGITIWAVFFRDKNPELTPDYAPQKVEQNAERIPGDDDKKMDEPEGGSSVSLSYSRDVSINLSDGNAELYFANPGKSNQNIVLQVMVQDQIVIQSGVLQPGNQVKKLDLLKDVDGILKEGGYDGKFVVLYYHPESGEKAVVNTEIPVTITVKK